MPKNGSRRQFVAALVLGFVAVPALALGTGLEWRVGGEAEPPTAALHTTMGVDPQVSAGARYVALMRGPTEEVVPYETALAEACGSDGLALVEKEISGELTPLQQGALDALREVCLDNEMPLPAKILPEPTEQIVIVQEVVQSPPPASATSGEDEPAGEHDDEEEEDGEEEEEDD